MSTHQLSQALELARRTGEPGRPVISLYVDLDPEEFATAPARATQIRSLLDELARDLETLEPLSHDERIGLRREADRLDRYLSSGELPVSGARALGVFAVDGEEELHTVTLAHPVAPRVVVDRAPCIEPLVETAEPGQWCVVLVNRRRARIFTGPGAQLTERQQIDDDVHREEQDVDRHLRAVADSVHLRWREHGFDRLVLGGPTEIVPRLASTLHDDLRPALHDSHIDADVATVNETQVRDAVAPLVELAGNELERRALNVLAQGLATEGRAAAGLGPTLQALNERRVQTLLLDPGFDVSGIRCPTCGLLSADQLARCPADGSPTIPLRHLREAAIESALAQDADVRIVEKHPDLGPHGGVAAVLRF